MKRSLILFGLVALVLIAAFTVYAVEYSTWGKTKATFEEEAPERLAKKPGGGGGQGKQEPYYVIEGDFEYDGRGGGERVPVWKPIQLTFNFEFECEDCGKVFSPGEVYDAHFEVHSTKRQTGFHVWVDSDPALYGKDEHSDHYFHVKDGETRKVDGGKEYKFENDYARYGCVMGSTYRDLPRQMTFTVMETE